MEYTCQYSTSEIELLNLDDGQGRGELGGSGRSARKPDIRVLVCRLGALPVVEFLRSDEYGSYLDSMQKIVGGLVQPIPLAEGLELWCNEGGRHLPLHRVIPAVAPPPPAGFEDCEVIRLDDDLALPGEPGEWRVRGDFFLARCTSDAELRDITDADITHYKQLWPEPVVPKRSGPRTR